eukprot:99029-Chlamydomonas_euryale.AAC.3
MTCAVHYTSHGPADSQVPVYRAALGSLRHTSHVLMRLCSSTASRLTVQLQPSCSHGVLSRADRDPQCKLLSGPCMLAAGKP